ncbi:MAG: hypothetical protein O2855_06195 [Planctomycetota bacterium]|nr:hypothetical protein [Planctomycetota bacterium]
MTNRLLAFLPLCLVIAGGAFAQAGVEGQYDLLYDTQSTLPPTTLATLATLAVAAPSPVAVRPAPVIVTPVAPAAPRAAAPVAPAPVIVTPRDLTLSNVRKDPKHISDYDFGEVVQTMRESVQPLSGELSDGFPRFIGEIDQAILLMDEGRIQEAVAMSANAVDGVLASRDGVVNPLWETQFYLQEQISMVRGRLAESISGGDKATAAGQSAAQQERMLDQVATRIAQTKDPIRKRRLIGHYRTIRTLGKAKAASVAMTPDQRKLWHGVLRVLEQATLAHQQVMMGAETLFSQLDGTSMQLRDYLTLMQTIDGVDAMLGSVQGGGMEGFVEGMKTLQDQMETFSESMQVALESSMADLESRVETIQAVESEDGSIMAPTSLDDELMSRINRVAPDGARKE